MNNINNNICFKILNKCLDKSKNKPALMVDNERNIKAVVIKLEDLEEEKNVTLNDNVNYYEFDILAIDIQEWDEKSRDEAGLETIAVKDIISFCFLPDIFPVFF